MTIKVVAAQPLKAEKAADALAAEVIDRTSAQYVDTKIKAFNDQLESIQEQLNTLVPRIAAAGAGGAPTTGLAALDKLVLVSSLDNAQARRGQLLDLQSDVQPAARARGERREGAGDRAAPPQSRRPRGAAATARSSAA